MGGIALTCTEGNVTACVVGGAFYVVLDGKPLPHCSVFTLSQGSKLQIRPGPWGSWCYLAFAGHMDVPDWLNSTSTHIGSNLCGRPLKAQDVISVQDTRTLDGVSGQIFDPISVKPPKQIRIVLGPQDRFFTAASIKSLEDSAFSLTADYNRQGVRLSGPKLQITQALDMPSEPIARGSLQVPGHGDPICLLADHQTTGGYPKIATVISADQDKMAQMRTGDSLRFKIVDVETATKANHIAQEMGVKLRQQIDDMRMSLDQKLWNSNLVSGIIDDIPE